MFSRGLFLGLSLALSRVPESKRILNVQTPRPPQTNENRGKNSTRRKKFHVSSPGVEFRVEYPFERRKFSMEKCLNVHANGVWNYDDYY